MINRLQAAVLALFALYWVAIVLILVAARPVFDQLLGHSIRVSGDTRPSELRTMLVLTVLLGLLSVGVIRRWRWTPSPQR